MHKKGLVFEAPSFAVSASVGRWLHQAGNVDVLQAIARKSLSASIDIDTDPELKLKVVASIDGDLIDVTLFYTVSPSMPHPEAGNAAIESIAVAMIEQFSSSALKLKRIDTLAVGDTETSTGIDIILRDEMLMGLNTQTLLAVFELERSQGDRSLVLGRVCAGLANLCCCLGSDATLPVLSPARLFRSLSMQKVGTSEGQLRFAAVVSGCGLDGDGGRSLTPAQHACLQLLVGGDVDARWLEPAQSKALALREALAVAATALYLGSLVERAENMQLLLNNTASASSESAYESTEDSHRGEVSN